MAELLVRLVQFPVRLLQFAGQAIDLQVGTHPHQYFPVLKRLDDVVHPAGLKTLDNGFGFGPGGDEKDGYVRILNILFQASAGLETVDAGHHHVEKNQIGARAPDDFERGFAIRRHQNAVPFGL